MLGETVARLQVEIGANLKGLNKSLKGAEGSLKQFGRRMDSIGRTMTKSVTIPLLGIGAAAVKVASDAAEMRSKFDVVFPKHGGSIIERLTEFAKATGQSKHELIGLSAGLGDIFKPLGFAEEAAGNLSAQMVELGVDLASFNNIPLDEALQRLQGTLVGSHENALKFGVVINENVLKQEMARIGANKLTGAQKEQAKVQARLNLLMRGTTDAQGDAARTLPGFANQVKALKNQLKDLGVEIGTKLLPLMTRMVGKLSDLAGWFSDLSGNEQKYMGWAVLLAAAVGPIATGLGQMLVNLRAIAGVLASMNPYILGALLGGAVFKSGVLERIGNLGAGGAMAGAKMGPNKTGVDFAKAHATPTGLTGVFAPVSAHTPAGAGGGGAGGGGVTTPSLVDPAAIKRAQVGFEVPLEATEKIKFNLKEIPMILREVGEAGEAIAPDSQWVRDLQYELQYVNEQVRHIGADMTIAFVDGLSGAIGQLATLQISFKDFLGQIKQIAQRILGDVIALIVKQKILNALKAKEVALTQATGGLLGSGLGKFLGLGALAIGGGILLGKAFQDSHKGSQVGSFLDNPRGRHNRSSAQSIQLKGTTVPSGDIHFSAATHGARLTRLGA